MEPLSPLCPLESWKAEKPTTSVAWIEALTQDGYEIAVLAEGEVAAWPYEHNVLDGKEGS